MAIKTIDINQDFDIDTEIVVSTEVPLRGWSVFNSININQTGDGANKTVEARIAYSIDGLTYSNFFEFNSPIGIPLKSDFIVMIKLFRTGSDVSGLINVTDIELNGTFNQSYFDLVTFSDPFSNISWDNTRWNKIWINLLYKLYKKGIVPEFITRGEENSFSGGVFAPIIEEDSDNLITEVSEFFIVTESSGIQQYFSKDSDYIAFWKTISWFYALIIELSFNKVSEFEDNKEDLLNHLKQFSHLVCDELSLSQLQSILNIAPDQFRLRGTYAISKSSSYFDNLKLDGELLRYICYNEDVDEFLFQYNSRALSGWLVDQTSPNWSGMIPGIYQMNKSPLSLQDFSSLQDFNAIGIGADANIITDGEELLELEDDTASSITSLTSGILQYENGNNVLINVDITRVVLEIDSNSIFQFEFECVVDTDIDYQFFTYINFSANSLVTINVKCFDADNNFVDGFKYVDGTEPTDPSNVNVLFEDSHERKNQYEKIGFSLLSFGSNSFNDNKPFLCESIKMSSQLINSVSVTITVDQGLTKFWDIKLLPLNLNQLGVLHSIDSYNSCFNILVNNNGSLTKNHLKSNVSKYLLPYGSEYLMHDLKTIENIDYLLSEEGDFMLYEDDNKIQITT